MHMAILDVSREKCEQISFGFHEDTDDVIGLKFKSHIYNFGMQNKSYIYNTQHYRF